MSIPIKGLEKFSVIDYPGKTCCIVFLAGCNFRCPYCHNPDLIERPGELEDIAEEEVLELMKSRRKWLDGICITGGEPCLNKGLPGFMKKVKEEGFLVKLDTNGTNPEMIEQLVGQDLVDYIAMDVKAPPERYGEVAGVDVDMKAIQESIGTIMASGVEHEFRTTVVPRLMGREDIRKISKWLKGARRYFIQGFRPGITLDRSYKKETTYSEKDLEELAGIARKHVKEVGVRQ